jgi:hypothetical protein
MNFLRLIRNFFLLADSQQATENRVYEPGEANALAGIHFEVAEGSKFINNDTAVEHPNADLGFASLVLVAHFV